MELSDLSVPAAIVQRLKDSGFDSVEAVTSAVPREVLGIRGIGPKALIAISAALGAHGLSFAEDTYAPYVCAREGTAANDVKLTDLWLCDECASDFETRPFGGTGPEYVGSSIGGYCMNCVEDKPSVSIRQWLLCSGCARLAQSFGQSVIASRGLLSAWNGSLAERTGVELVETDPPRLNRFVRGSRVADKQSSADFEGRLIATGKPVFGIEQKTGQAGLGPAAVSPMSRFQLDCSDCDDIAAVAEREDMPVFLVHAQAIQRAKPPTRLWLPVGYWWTDGYSMAAHCLSVANRGREIRPAAYYDVRIFKPLATFADYIEQGGVEEFRRRVEAEGRFPAMYPGQARQLRR